MARGGIGGLSGEAFQRLVHETFDPLMREFGCVPSRWAKGGVGYRASDLEVGIGRKVGRERVEIWLIRGYPSHIQLRLDDVAEYLGYEETVLVLRSPDASIADVLQAAVDFLRAAARSLLVNDEKTWRTVERGVGALIAERDRGT